MSKKIAIVHDWLIGGGAEKVVLELHRMYPDAPIYTSYASAEWRERLDDKVVTGYLQHLGKIRKFIPFLRAYWFSNLDLSQYDVIISSSGNGEANHARTTGKTRHINYCHSPTHFYWTRYDEYIKNPGFGVLNPLVRIGLKLLIRPLKGADFNAAQRADVIIANSSFIKDQIKKYYKRDAVVIHPPVDTERFANKSSQKRSGFVCVGRQVPSKHLDLAIAACNATKKDLTVIGFGPQNSYLKSIAGPTVTFIDRPSDEELTTAVQSAEAFLFPCMDDFGIAPVEALAAGTPVIALKAGGALDYVIPGKTGEFFDEQSVESLAETIDDFDPTAYDHDEISSFAEKFSRQNFVQNIKKLLA